MSRGVYVDCFSGASGDMLLGALLDAGVALDDLRAGLETLPIAGWALTAEPVQDKGLSGTRARVTLDERQQQPPRRLSDIEAILSGADALPEAVRERACDVF